MPEVAHILVAIRDWDLRDFAHQALAGAGYHVTTAATRAAAAYMLESARPPCVALVDAADPLLDGSAHQACVVIDVERQERYGIDEVGAIVDAVRKVVPGDLGTRR